MANTNLLPMWKRRDSGVLELSINATRAFPSPLLTLSPFSIDFMKIKEINSHTVSKKNGDAHTFVELTEKVLGKGARHKSTF